MAVGAAGQPNKNSAKSAKTARRRFRLLMVSILCLLSWAAVIYWDQEGKLVEKHAEVDALNKQLADVKSMNDKAKKEIDRLNDREYVEQKIRKELNYVKEGETIFSVTQP